MSEEREFDVLAGSQLHMDVRVSSWPLVLSLACNLITCTALVVLLMECAR